MPNRHGILRNDRLVMMMMMELPRLVYEYPMRPALSTRFPRQSSFPVHSGKKARDLLAGLLFSPVPFPAGAIIRS
jgi:hypothetical protein